MEDHPPYLLDNGDDSEGSGVSVACDVDTAMIEMDVRGRWSSRLGTAAYTAFGKCLAEHPSAIIVNLWSLGDPSGDSAPMWLASCQRAVALQPPVRVALTMPTDTPLADRLGRIGANLIPAYRTTAEARAAVAGRTPYTDRLQSSALPPEPAAAGTARSVVDEACDVWDFPELRYPSRLIITELVANAAEYARTDMVVTVWRRGTGLHLSVRDGDPRMPFLRDPQSAVSGAPIQKRGHGLRIVDTLSSAWGAMATRDGKMVWATVDSCRRRWPMKVRETLLGRMAHDLGLADQAGHLNARRDPRA